MDCKKCGDLITKGETRVEKDKKGNIFEIDEYECLRCDYTEEYKTLLHMALTKTNAPQKSNDKDYELSR